MFRSEAAEFAAGRLREVLNQKKVSLSLTVSLGMDISGQGYRLSEGDGGFVLLAGGESGAMYGLMDIADHVACTGTAKGMKLGEKLPYIKKRGIKLNVPLDARTPSYTDCGDSAQQNIANMWDMDFWRGLLDRMALARYNVLTLWNLCPFPSMVSVPEYPRAALCDVMRGAYPAGGTSRALGFYTPQMKRTLIRIKSMTIEEKMDFWRAVMAYAASRCIAVYLFTWNIYLYGLEDAGYRLTESPADERTCDYYMRSVAALVRAYPLLAGIGVTAGENMNASWTEQQDVHWVRKTYGRGIELALSDQPERKFTLIHRSHMTTVFQMQEAFEDFSADFELSFKYSMAHMATVEKPHFGDAFFAQLGPGQKTWLTLRNDDFYTFPWADPDFLGEYVKNMPRDVMAGFYVGADGIIWGRDYQSRNPALNGRYVVDKHWFAFSLLGFAGYQGTLYPGQAQAMLKQHFPSMPAETLLAAWQNASRAVPLLQRVYWRPYDFQWYPEACVSLDEEEKQLVFHDLNHFMQGVACPGSGYLSVSETVDAMREGCALSQPNALSVAGEIRACCHVSGQALKMLPEAQTAQERELIADIDRMIDLGLYYADKLTAAVRLMLYKRAGSQEDLRLARAAAESGYSRYLSYSQKTAVLYKPQLLSRLRGVVSPEQFDVRAGLDVLIAQDETR